MTKVNEKGAGRSARIGQFSTGQQAKTQSASTATRVVKPAPATGSFSRAEARLAVMSVMNKNDNKRP
ncbi:hypothetical protein GJ697_05845 [Pseudoduganella sp. FT25W]|jgi:hypothetical protein|uniref:Uncharacterized protein n=1 Tax=Duganella alba TaxID=2666081 RepID=A0A6L5QC49_9BURK|nr:hypothetical protein [Duganella alba]MRX07354.1 hypothetical protein [Duganella alba]MRX19456.1 hypothetical protein [Duganella alba]